ncbi:MAG: hypothetical protein ACXAC2_02570 [Candidatus Kariarchaeaceae archaeon]|jgi:hypothetical protein
MASGFSSIPVRSNSDKVLAQWFNDMRTAGIADNGDATTHSFSNIGIVHSTAVDTNDTLVITGYQGTALSANNKAVIVTSQDGNYPGYGEVQTLSANVTILLTGAHWGLDTKGDKTSVQLHVYAINDGVSMKIGVSDQDNINTIAKANTDHVPGNITATGDMLVNSALDTGTTSTYAVTYLGWHDAAFTDVGDIWECSGSYHSARAGAFLQKPDKYINASYALATGDSMANSSFTLLDYDTQIEDTHSAYSSGVFTAPTTGRYMLTAAASLVATAGWIAGEIAYLSVYKNGVINKVIAHRTQEHTNSLRVPLSGSYTMQLNIGETMSVYMWHSNGGAVLLDADVTLNHITINRVG